MERDHPQARQAARHRLTAEVRATAPARGGSCASGVGGSGGGGGAKRCYPMSSFFSSPSHVRPMSCANARAQRRTSTPNARPLIGTLERPFHEIRAVHDAGWPSECSRHTATRSPTHARRQCGASPSTCTTPSWRRAMMTSCGFQKRCSVLGGAGSAPKRPWIRWNGTTFGPRG